MKKIFWILPVVIILAVASLYRFVYSDSSKLKIISPVQNFRVGDSYAANKSVPIYLELLYSGTDPVVTATVQNTAGTVGTVCELKTGEQKSCYFVPVTATGETRFKIQIQESSGKQITKQFSVFWNPYNPLEWALYYLGARNLNNGFLLLAMAAIIFFAIKRMIKTKNFGQTIAVVWGGASFAAFYLLWGYLGSAVIPFFLIVISWTALSLWAYAKFFYKKPTNNVVPVSISRVGLSTGTSLTKKTSNSTSVVKGKVLEDD